MFARYKTERITGLPGTQILPVMLCNASSNMCSVQCCAELHSASLAAVRWFVLQLLRQQHWAIHMLLSTNCLWQHLQPARLTVSLQHIQPSVTATGILAIQVFLVVYNTCFLRGGCGYCSSSASPWRLPAAFDAGTDGTSFVLAGTHTKSVLSPPGSCRTAIPSAVLLLTNLKPPSASASRDRT